MVRYGILNLVNQCTGCRSCMLACKDVHVIPANNYNGQSAIANGREYYRIWPVDLEQGTYPYVVRNEDIYRCMQCQSPACVPACPNKALIQRADGIVVVDTTKCTGQQKCVAACPYGAIYYRADTKKADKCDLCATVAGYIDSGNSPMCVQACLSNALVFGDLDDPNSTISLEMAKQSTYTQSPQYGLKPSVYYIYHQALMHATVVNPSGIAVPGATATATEIGRAHV
jgi:tetrathionate reductase subunit B